MWRRYRTLFVMLIGPTFVSAVSAGGESMQGKQEERPRFFFDVALGWTATRGNDVQVGDRTTISRFGLFDEGTTFEPLVTRMGNDLMPYARLGYQGAVWGVEGEFWWLTAEGALNGSFSQRDVAPRSEMVRLWGAWHGEDDEEASFGARNSLSIHGGRVDLTRFLSSALSLTVGMHLAKFENERDEHVQLASDFMLSGPTGRPIFVSLEETKKGVSRADGWLVGPSVGLRGSAILGSVTRVGYSFSQSVLFTELDHQAHWELTPAVPDDIEVETTMSSRASVPVTDLRGSLSFDLGGHFSIGVQAFISLWYDVPTSLEFSIPLEEWREPRRSLVFAAVGPFVTVRF